MSKDTRWPSDRLYIPAASTAVAWTNTSLAPPSGEMKPKPLDELKNFTVPIVILQSFTYFDPATAGAAKQSVWKFGPGQARTRRVGIRARFFWPIGRKAP